MYSNIIRNYVSEIGLSAIVFEEKIRAEYNRRRSSLAQNESANLVANDGNTFRNRNGTLTDDIHINNHDNNEIKHVRSTAVELTSLTNLDKEYLKELAKEEELKKQNEDNLPNHERRDSEFKDNLNEFLKNQKEIFNDICNPDINNNKSNDDINDTNSDENTQFIKDNANIDDYNNMDNDSENESNNLLKKTIYNDIGINDRDVDNISI